MSIFLFSVVISYAYLEQAMPHQSKNGPNMTTGTTPATTVKAPSMTSNSYQKHGQKQRAGDLFNDVVRLEPTGNHEQAPPVKKGKPS
jgi:hypothetical protein